MLRIVALGRSLMRDMPDREAALLRRLIDETNQRLGAIEREHASLLSALAAYEDRLSFLEGGEPSETARASRALNPRTQSVAGRQGTIGLVSAVLEVLQDAQGEPLHVKAILPRALAKGARTNAKNPLGVVDMVAANLRRDGKPVDKTGPRTWRWVGASPLPFPPAE